MEIFADEVKLPNCKSITYKYGVVIWYKLTAYYQNDFNFVYFCQGNNSESSNTYKYIATLLCLWVFVVFLSHLQFCKA